ncbi:MAG TPA: hypothetical protein VKV39_18485 [Candidatus Sulfotelmatobacter sp.]|nr:hypothetical protein [Candidatus Sulfotelmatobacter sp.]
MSHKATIPIWLFIGILLTIYGVLILGAGISSFSSAEGASWAMASLHLQIWWGLLLIALGLTYVISFWKKRDGGSGNEPR